MVDKIKQLCKNAGISLNALEQEIGIGKSTIYRWDYMPPALDKVQKVADYFGVSLDYLSGRDEYAQPVIIGAAAHLDTNDPEAIEEYNKLVEYLNFKYSKKD